MTSDTADLPRDARRARGQASEELALEHLLGLGYRLVTRNHRCDRGEIDIIAWEGDVLCFVEVRSRRDAAHGHPLESISGSKRARIVAAALDYLARWDGEWPEMRFDAVGIVLDEPPSLELVRGAFEVDRL